MIELTSTNLFSYTAVTIFVIALYSIITHPDFLRKIIAINILGSAVFLYAVAYASGREPLDHVAHAVVLTGIVVAVAGTALALTIFQRLQTLEKDDSEKDVR